MDNNIEKTLENLEDAQTLLNNIEKLNTVYENINKNIERVEKFEKTIQESIEIFVDKIENDTLSIEKSVNMLNEIKDKLNVDSIKNNILDLKNCVNNINLKEQQTESKDIIENKEDKEIDKYYDIMELYFKNNKKLPFNIIRKDDNAIITIEKLAFVSGTLNNNIKEEISYDAFIDNNGSRLDVSKRRVNLEKIYKLI